MEAISRSHLQALPDGEFLALLARRGVELRLQAGKLRITAPVGAIDEDLKGELVRRKAMLHASCESGNAYIPLSYAQERLWVLEQFHPGNYAYNIPESSDIRAAVHPEMLQRAIDLVVGRHETLRTDMQQDAKGTPVQRVHSQLAVKLHLLDYSEIETAIREREMQTALRAFSRQPFDLAAAPLVRFYLIRMAPERSIVFINIHHINSDKWSIRLLLRELLAAYSAYAQGQEPELPALPIQYSEYARRERALDTPAVHEQLQYWKSRLSSLPDPLHLPFTLHAAATHPFDGAIHEFSLSEAVTQAIRSLARANNISPYMLLLAAYTALLHRFTGASDICIGTPVSARQTTDTEPLIGFFVNTLVMRCSVEQDMTFVKLLQGVRETVLDAQANQEIPFQKILTELQNDARAKDAYVAQAPVFQTMMGFDSYAGGASATKSATESTVVPLDPGFAKFDLTLQMYEDPQRIGGYFEYRTDLFNAASIARFTEAFLLLLREAVESPTKTIAELNIVSAVERERLLHGWNVTNMEFPRDQTIHRLFEEQVARTPDAIAVIDRNERFSYAVLNRRANRVAYGLLDEIGRLDVAAGQAIVGVHLERSVEMIVAMLGILKAGAAYLPLDTQYPEERLRFMLDDSGASFVLSEHWIANQTGSRANALSLAFSRLHVSDPEINPAVQVASDMLAYVIYTSGSTGRPKGVAIEHHSTVSFLYWGREAFAAEDLRGTLAATSISFDLSVFEIFLPLSTGGTVILARDILELGILPAAAEITLATTVPSAALALLDSKSIPPTLRTINLAGEPLSSSLVDRLYAETSIAAVNDLYGPTETTTYSTWTRRQAKSRPSIGRPLANTRAFLVDSSLQLVPQGMPGELLIAGEGVARGYLGRPELTAERFVTLTHLGEAGRAYRTGDLCQYNDDGTLVYLGRMDQQVKIRGFRIEIGEVEAALRDHPTIEDAVVIVHAEADGAALAAAVRLKTDHPLDIPGLIAHQAATLPLYMLAKNIVAVDQYPRTANGKIDRKRVGLLSFAHESQRVIEKPRDPLEQELVAIWQEGFHLSQISIDDDFFQLGGHSLLALRLFGEIESRLGSRMMLSVLFQAPTVRLLAQHLRLEKTA